MVLASSRCDFLVGVTLRSSSSSARSKVISSATCDLKTIGAKPSFLRDQPVTGVGLGRKLPPMPSRAGFEPSAIAVVAAAFDVAKCQFQKCPLVMNQRGGTGRCRKAYWGRCCPVVAQKQRKTPTETRIETPGRRDLSI